MPKITVIVPVYNIRDYIEKCAESILAQDMPDWELLLVDDGSEDGSGELCDELAARDGRIKTLRKPNGGVGSARNAGLDAAAGEYICFVDGDDSAEPSLLSRLLALAEETGAQVCSAGAVCVDETGTAWRELRPARGVFADGQILRQFLMGSDGLYGCWGKLFSRAAVGKTRFSAYTRAEDALFCVEVLRTCRIYAAADETLYRYFRRSDSVTMSTVRTASADQVRAWEEIYGILETDAPELCPFAAEKLVHDVDQLWPAYRRERPEGWREQCAYLRGVRARRYLRQYADGKISPRSRIADLIFRLSPALFYCLAAK